MNHPGVVPLRGICPFHSFVRPLEKLGIGPQPGFIDPPIAGLIVEGISDVVDLGVLEKLAPHFTVDSSALYLRHVAVFQTDLDSWIRSGVIGRAGKNAVNLEQKPGIIFFREGRVVHR